MEDPTNIGAEISSLDTSTGAQNPPVDADDIEDYGYPYASDPRDSEPVVDEEAKTDEEGATAPEPTEDEKALEEELQKLQEAEPGKSPGGYLRRLAEGALTSKRAAEARVAELEAELADATGVTFRPTVPAEEFDGREFLNGLYKDHAAYYPAIVKDAFLTHLDPVRFRTEPEYAEAIMPVIQQVFVERWLPEFVQSEYGLDLPTFERITTAAIQAHLSGSAVPAFGTPTGFQPQQAPIDQQELAKKYGINTETEPELLQAVTEGAQAKQQMAIMQAQQAKIQKQLDELKAAQGDGSKAKQETEAQERVAQFDTLVTADRQRLLDTKLRGLPRNADGTIHKDFAHLPKKIERLVKLELDEDTDYRAKHGHAQKWFRQPGSADSAKRLAAGDLKPIFAKHQAVIDRIASEELQPYMDRIRLTSKVDQVQRAQNPLKGGESLSTPTTPTNGQLPQRRRPETTAERATRLYDAAHQ